MARADMKFSKEEVLKAVANKMSLDFGYTCPPKVKMNNDGSVEVDLEQEHNKGLRPKNFTQASQI